MTAARAWTGSEPLPNGRAYLLEASAGTGKTWQIEALVVRLVAEYGLSVDRLLVITFTEAATSELRERIRRRLADGREALARDDEPEDPIFAALWRDAPLRSARRSRLEQALSAFDVAPIFTIHGFANRMLDELAFESGREPGLELLADPSPLLEELVVDELARVYDRAGERQLAVLADMGWEVGALRDIASEMTRAVAPIVTPAFDEGDSCADVLAPVERWLVRVDAFGEWLDGAAGRTCVEALEAELDRPTRPSRGTSGRRLDGRYLRGGAGPAIERLRRWLAGGALRSERMKDGGLATFYRDLRIETLRDRWKGAPEELERFGAAELFSRLSALGVEQESLWALPRVSFAREIRARVHRELERRGLLTYDTMLSQLSERIDEQGRDGPLASAIRDRFDAALVDEFQDTDGAQWAVLEAAFAHPERRLFLVGDPKQAIYAFRGADVRVYLAAARIAGDPWTMRSNRRSDGGYVRAINHLFAAGSGVFGLKGVDYVDVAPHHEQARIRQLPPIDGRPRRPFELRWFDAVTSGRADDRNDAADAGLGKGEAGELAPRLCALEAARLLGAPAQILESLPPGRAPAWRPVVPGDIAVLVRNNRQADRVREQLAALRIPAVTAGRGSVLESPVVAWLCALLDALAAPGRDRPARALAVTPLFGWTGEELVRALAAYEPESREARPMVERSWDRWIATLAGWARLYASQGFFRTLESALDAHDVLPRLLELQAGERYATDLRHLAELCHVEERRTRLGPAALSAWLRAGARRGSTHEADARALRLESDARAVQIVTIHKSKGLEYPIVLVPFGWDARPTIDGGQPIRWHAGEAWAVSLDLHAKCAPGRKEALDASERENAEEEIRMLYVALTRARHYCAAWLAPIDARGGPPSALWRIVTRPRDGGGQAPDRFDPEPAIERLGRLAAASEGTVGFSREPRPGNVDPPRLQPESAGPLRARPWSRTVPLVSPFQVLSYSSLVHARARDEPLRPDEALAGPSGEELGDGNLHEGDADAGVALALDPPAMEPGARAELGRPVYLAAMRGGTDVGTWVHAVLEKLDFRTGAAKDGGDPAALVRALGERCGVREGAQHELLLGALPRLLDTPLDGGGGAAALPPGFCLRDLGSGSRLDELGFDLRLGAGSRVGREGVENGGLVQEAAFAAALETRLEHAPDWPGAIWLRPLLDRRREGKSLLPAVAGILTGFIDLTLRVGDDPRGRSGRTRYFVADYKTNRIAAPAARRETLEVHYTQPWLYWEMARRGYPLQALLYSVALHRMLQQRLGESYEYDEHVGGYLYLFLRGMQGKTHPRDAGLALGVLCDRWPKDVVLGVDAALCGHSVDGVRRVMDRARRGANA